MKKLTILLLLLALGLFAQLPPPPLTITTPDTAPVGLAGNSFVLALNAQGGAPPYVWTVTGQPDWLKVYPAVLQGTPTDAATFQVVLTIKDSATPQATAQKNVSVTIQGPWGPYETPTPVTICQVDTSTATSDGKMAPSTDSVTNQPRCFIVPQAVSEACARFMLQQTTGRDANGNVTYVYANWWDFVLKKFLGSVVMPMIDQFPPPSVVAAQQAAAAAAAAVDAAKTAAATGQKQ
jgi:hypothetical protein